jgi:DNA repair photolyase
MARLDQPAARKGRGAQSNRDGRFERLTHEAAPDGWDGTGEDDLPPLRTTVAPDTSRTVIARNESPDIGFDRSLNPYRGCEHGCVYCYARPTHAYLGLSPGLDFETRLFAKHDAPELLRRELGQPRYRPAPLALGTNTDPYQPIERNLQITRRVLEVLAECRHPVTITTKSALVLRDLDILAGMAAQNLARVAISVTSLDRALARALEPRAPAPARRLQAIRALGQAGVPVAVMVAPVIPALTDHELEAILQAAADAGASDAGYVLLRLPLEIKELFEEWLKAHAPLKAERVLSRIRALRGGKLNDANFGSRMTGSGVEAELLERRFALGCERFGLGRDRHKALDVTAFQKPRLDPRQFELL